MNTCYKYMIILLLWLASATTYASYSGKCLDDCFSTHHDCLYCAYQCRRDDMPTQPEADNDYHCPLDGYRGEIS
jgi:hypothetical protein